MTDIPTSPPTQATDDATLLEKINEAVVVVNDAEKSVATAQVELGLLLLEAKALHPTVKDFKAFLNRVDGLKLSRAYELMRLAGGRTTNEELKKDTRERRQRSRNKKKISTPTPTFRDVPESQERKPDWINAAEQSSHALKEFKFACKTWLPRLTEEVDREEAVRLVDELLPPSALTVDRRRMQAVKEAVRQRDSKEETTH